MLGEERLLENVLKVVFEEVNVAAGSARPPYQNRPFLVPLFPTSPKMRMAKRHASAFFDILVFHKEEVTR